MLTNYLPVLWLAVTVVMVVLEASTYQLVCIWFALGGVAAFLASILGWWGFQGQLVLFVLVSLISLAVTRPFMKKVLKTKPVATNADQIIGKEGVVTQRITPMEKGRIRISGLDWSAASDTTVEIGAVVEILSIEGVTVKVRPKA